MATTRIRSRRPHPSLRGMRHCSNLHQEQQAPSTPSPLAPIPPVAPVAPSRTASRIALAFCRMPSSPPEALPLPPVTSCCGCDFGCDFGCGCYHCRCCCCCCCCFSNGVDGDDYPFVGSYCGVGFDLGHGSDSHDLRGDHGCHYVNVHGSPDLSYRCDGHFDGHLFCVHRDDLFDGGVEARSTESVATLQPRPASSSYLSARRPISVVHTGVKSAG